MTPSGTVVPLRPLPSPRSPQRRPITAARTVGDRRRILLCDDESQTLHALRVVLHGAGFEVDATHTATEALNRGALCLPAAAIIELTLPDGDGVEVWAGKAGRRGGQ